MEKTPIVWLLCAFATGLTYAGNKEPTEYHGMCINMLLRNMEKLKLLENCKIVIGDLQIASIETTSIEDFVNLTFPKLKEVTGNLVIYRVSGLQTLSTLLPNLARIRGNTLLRNYALMVFDCMHLTEIGLHSLLKIDRGGVIVWGTPLTCFVNTINWKAIAQRYRHVLSEPDRHTNCNFPCTCSANPETNYCWNNRKCQIFLEGPESYHCSEECFGCRNTNSNNCTLCREYTYEEKCLSQCPQNTFLLTESNHCLTKDECIYFDRFVFNGTCILDCPEGFVERGEMEEKTCVSCPKCHKTCGNQTIQALDALQMAKKCVYINGSLTIHIWSIPNLVNELRDNLNNIVEVTDYIVIYSSISIASFDFFSSLQKIKGRRLFNGKYSLAVFGMDNLQSLFLPNVTRNLKVEKGTLRFYNNPILCMNYINKLKDRFPVAPNEFDIPQAMNGYSGSCVEISLKLSVQVKNETFAIASFYPSSKEVHYTILYVRIPHNMNTSIVPETCSDSEWFSINVPESNTDKVKVALTSLRPSSNYAICVEKYEPSSRQLARSSIVKFNTHVGKPEPPFIFELVASSPSNIMIKWADHLDYRPYITRYELDVHMVDISDDDLSGIDYCGAMDEEWYDTDITLHAKVMKPPENYGKGCESMCGVLSSVPIGTMREDYFDVCDIISHCNDNLERPNNFSIAGAVKSLSFDLNKGVNRHEVSGLAPFRDYKFYLRACTKDACSRSSKGIVRTMKLEHADVASTTFANVREIGLIYVRWEPPKVTNGPLLAYIVEIYPDIKVSDLNHIVPQTRCVPANNTDLAIYSNKAKTYLVRVCTKTLARAYVCNEWKKIEYKVDYELALWSGITFGLLICVLSSVIGWRWKRREPNSDTILLFDATSFYRHESEPVAQISDLVLPNDVS